MERIARLKFIDFFFDKLINSTSFNNKLVQINSNYPNLKQELFIRNCILEEFNNNYLCNEFGLRSFAEHPRKNGRTDLCFVDINGSIIKVELKFQFTKDANDLKSYTNVIKKDFETKESDYFILIICDFDIEMKNKFDRKWNLSTSLTKHVSQSNEWENNILCCFDSFSANSTLREFNRIVIDKPYPTFYNFYLLKKNFS
ncbi:hypothetical protein [uncultured Flavobacterium sp.]|uniref:hypothetical protein n=1 Tax=uncultured Flavobacterium sp. TaxID=165435 RepID=UPI0025E3730F|nr:hypothetical protein [uncultured Flavobacterium sp.]